MTMREPRDYPVSLSERLPWWLWAILGVAGVWLAVVLVEALI